MLKADDPGKRHLCKALKRKRGEKTLKLTTASAKCTSHIFQDFICVKETCCGKEKFAGSSGPGMMSKGMPAAICTSF